MTDKEIRSWATFIFFAFLSIILNAILINVLKFSNNCNGNVCKNMLGYIIIPFFNFAIGAISILVLVGTYNKNKEVNKNEDLVK